MAVGGRLIRTFEGRCEGTIALSAKGGSGFGYYPIFIPRGCGKTIAQLGSNAKDAMSHRARAIEKFNRWFKERDLKLKRGL